MWEQASKLVALPVVEDDGLDIELDFGDAGGIVAVTAGGHHSHSTSFANQNPHISKENVRNSATFSKSSFANQNPHISKENVRNSATFSKSYNHNPHIQKKK